jgi:ABC-type antimicrobial peptide transport system permease subunit
MSTWQFILRSLKFHWRIHVAVALGVAAATAVLTGALLVGDSVRGSLRRLTLDRLGRIDEVLVTDRFFAVDLATRLQAAPAVRQHYSAAVPAILFSRGIVEMQAADRSGRAAQVLIVGCGADFWTLGDARYRTAETPGRNEIVLNAPLAEDLQARVGDEVVLRLPKANQVPADSPLGRKSDRVRALAGLRVVAIVPAESLGRFSLTASQATPRNAYVARETLQAALDQEDRVNAILVAGQSQHAPPGAEARTALADAFHPALADYGFALQHVRRTFQPGDGQAEEVVFEYLSLTTDRMLFSPPAERAALRAWEPWGAQSVSTYLANSLEKVSGDEASPVIPYSLITAVDSQPVLGPLLAEDGTPIVLADDEIALNSWAANDLNATLGDRIRVTFYRPETTHGRLEEESAEFVLRAIVPLTEPHRPFRRNRSAEYRIRPTLANDPDLTPIVEGVTDQDSIDNWEAPFPVDRTRVRPVDDAYWRNHRTTPKAFVSLAAGKRLWSSRFGEITSVRVAVPRHGEQPAFAEQMKAAVRSEFERDRAALGFRFLPVKQRGLAASAGTTPFDVLFLFLSFFIIAAALMLVALQFRLGVERRAREIGTLLAVGFWRPFTARLFAAEGAVVAAIGAALGVAAGVGYAWLMLVGLRTWWIGAISTPFLGLYIEPLSLVIGYVSGVAISVLTIAFSLRRTRRISVRRLLAGQAVEADELVYAPAGRGGWIWAAVLFAAAAVLAVAATRLGGEAQAGAFVGSGTLVLAALLTVIRRYLKSGGRAGFRTTQWSLRWLAARNAARNPGRSTLTVGLMAVASFLIVAMSSFRLAPTAAGTGGFELVAESAEPVFGDWDTPAGREQLLADQAAVLDGSTVLPLRLQAGDDASCNNLYQASQPRVLGVTESFVRHFDDPAVQAFAWADSAAESTDDKGNPWRLLPTVGPPFQTVEPGGDASPRVIRAVLDKNTAMYSLHLYGGVGEEFELTYPEVGPIRFRVVGLLSNSILQGALLIGEADFVRRFPDVSGYRYFLIQSPAGRSQAVATALEDRLGDQGFDAASARERLEDLLAVQNTYLSTFQSLGALGLLLGTFGLAAVQMRNVIERRGELALLRAAGFRRRRLARLVMIEALALLAGGLLTGFLAALVTTLPHIFVGGASIPLGDLTILLVIVLVVGSLTSLASVRTVLRAPLMAALREE